MSREEPGTTAADHDAVDPHAPVWASVSENRPSYEQLWDWYVSAYRAQRHWRTRAAYLVRIINLVRHEIADPSLARLVTDDAITGVQFEARPMGDSTIVALTRDGSRIEIP